MWPRVGPAGDDEDKGGGGQFRGILCPVRASAVSKLLMRCVDLVIVCALLAVGVLSAQERPDFSGEWVRVVRPEDPPPVLRIIQDGQTIRIEVRSSRSARPLGRRNHHAQTERCTNDDTVRLRQEALNGLSNSLFA